ncbi:MAG: patatin family protein [Clostridium sp.]|nr:patatin family protein [Clostridium sp.]
MKTGLVLEGGAMRGMFTAGVTDVMMENGIQPDGIIGVSAGAVFGCNYKSGQIGRVIRYNTRFCKDPRYCSFRSLLRTGDLFGVDFCYREIPEKLDVFDNDAFRSSPMEFYLVCTDVEMGEAVYHKCEDIGPDELKWMRASASMPLVSNVVEVGGYRLLDGGIVDSIPLRRFEEMGYERNLVILTQPRDYVKKKNKALPLARKALKEYPRAIEAMAVRHEVYNAATAYVREREAQGAALVICPDGTLPIRRVERDPEKLWAVYQIGRETAQRKLAEICAFFADK